MRLEPLLQLRNVRVRFDGVLALDLEALDVPDVSGVAAIFVGPNGAGKTTLLNAITGYAITEPGTSIRLRGERDNAPDVELSGLRSDAIVRAGIARTFQVPLLFASLRVREAMLLAARFGRALPWYRWFGSLARRLGDDVEAVQRVDALLDVLDLLPEAEAPLSALPLPMLRRAELGRCLAAEPRLLMMLDEPTAGADDVERATLVSLLDSRLPAAVADLHHAGLYRHPAVTVGIVTHDMVFARCLAHDPVAAPMVYVLDRGRISVCGRLDQVMSDPNVRNVYLGAA